jgi:hypothetical protein
LAEEQDRMRCAHCRQEILGIPIEVREPVGDGSQRLTTYFCARPCLKEWVHKLE